MIENIYISCAVRREKETEGVGGNIWKYNKSLSGLADLFAIVDTAKCPRLRCWMREQAAVFSCECLGERLIRETFKKAAVALLYIFGYKDTI